MWYFGEDLRDELFLLAKVIELLMFMVSYWICPWSFSEDELEIEEF